MANKFKKTILVTGGSGFIGSNYLNICVPRHTDTLFVNIDCLTYAADQNNIVVNDCPNYVFHKVDIRSRLSLERIFKKYSPYGIIHFAAESHVDKSINDPQIFIETNVAGTHNLLYFAQKFGVKRYHQVSTDEVYGSLPLSAGTFTENSPIRPNSPYSASKAAADLLVRAYEKTYGLYATITRCSNNYGPRQDASKIIPLFIRNLLRGGKVPLYGTGKNVRDWLYVEDHVEAIDLVFRKGKKGEVYNVGGGIELDNLTLTKKLIKLCGRDLKAIQYVEDRKGHDLRYAIDGGKIRKELGWRPRTSFDAGLNKTLEYYRPRAK